MVTIQSYSPSWLAHWDLSLAMDSVVSVNRKYNMYFYCKIGVHCCGIPGVSKRSEQSEK